MPLPQSSSQGLGSLADPDPLPPAPFLERYLFQDPIPTAVFLCIAAAIGWWWLQRVGKPRASWIVATVCPALAGLVLLLAQFVVTQRETLVARCRELVNATIAMKADEAAGFLRSDATASGARLPTEYSRDRIVQSIREKEPIRLGMKEANLKWVTATLDGPNFARTQCRVQVQMPIYDAWFPTTWMIHWVRADANAPWQVGRIEAQQIGFN